MRTAGTVLKQARQKRGISLARIAKETKIKEKFLEALESGDWQVLPNLSIAQGFARSFARAVDVDSQLILALLRRDFPKSFSTRGISQEIFVSPRFVWTPRATIIAVGVLTVGIACYYLVRQYILFVAPPPLEVNVSAKEATVEISGKTAPLATVEINKRPVLVEEDGRFSVYLEKPEASAITVVARSRTGKETTKVMPVTQ